MSIEGKWGYSRDEETYTGAFDTRQEAIDEGLEYSENGVYVGQYQAPSSPEEYIDAEDLFEKVCCQDEYCGDWAEGTLDCTREQQDELTEAIRRVFGEWIDRHGLRPTFGLVYDSQFVTPKEASE